MDDFDVDFLDTIGITKVGHSDLNISDGGIDTCEDLSQGSDLVTAGPLAIAAESELKILGDLTFEQSSDWYSVEVNAHEDLSLIITDRCGLALNDSNSVQIKMYHGLEDITSAQRLTTVGHQDQLSIRLPHEGTYYIEISALSLTQDLVPYVLHAQRGATPRCLMTSDCCDDDICEIEQGDNEGLCLPTAPREEEPNESADRATRLRFLGGVRTRGS